MPPEFDTNCAKLLFLLRWVKKLPLQQSQLGVAGRFPDFEGLDELRLAGVDAGDALEGLGVVDAHAVALAGAQNRMRHVNRRFQIFAGCLALVFVLPARAQVSAGQILHNLRSEQRRRQALPRPVPRASTPQPAARRIDSHQAIEFVLRRMRFVGAPLHDRIALQHMVAPYLNRAIDFATLQQAADRVAAHYRRRGLLVHVQYPAQDITSGTVTMRIVMAQLGDVVLQGSPRNDASRIKDWIYAAVPRGSPIALPALERSLLLLDDLPGYEVSGSLTRGIQPGSSDLDLRLSARRSARGVVSLDDFGSASTGRSRVSAQLGVAGMLGFGTRVGLSAMHATGTDFIQADLGLPLDDNGWRFGVGASRMQYKILNPTFRALVLSGNSTSAGLHLSYPLLRSRPANLWLRAEWNFTAIRSGNAGGEVADQCYDTRVGHAELDANWLGRGVNTGSLQLFAGNIGRARSGSYNAVYMVAGNFAKLHYAIGHTQTIAGGLSGQVSLSGQIASRNLDSSEQMYLGGPYAVRAYTNGQLPATQGQLLSVNLHQALPRRMRAELFYDFGAVQTWKFNSPANNDSNRYTVQDIGLGLSWRGPHGCELTGSWAYRLGQLDPSVASYLKRNGGLASNSVWLMASLPFGD